MKPFARFAWSVLAYDVAVIAWGAIVRATGSGAGCGRHWPMCNGEIVPRSPAAQTVVEFTHRTTSGVALVLAVALVAWARRSFPAGHPARKAAAAGLGFMLAEALLGAGLVLFGWVASDASAGRGWAVTLHLANTFLLLAAVSLTAAWSARPDGERAGARGALPVVLGGGFVAVVLAGLTGAIAALGDTLFPATSLAEGLRQDVAASAHVLLRLRVLHPFAAVAAAAALVAAAQLAARARPEPLVRRAALAVAVLLAAQLAVGAANLALLAPVFLQIVHLVLADLLWIALVLLAAWSFAPRLAEPAVAPAERSFARPA
jgi:cytochrome c oxidase assembly protein subunit 15